MMRRRRAAGKAFIVREWRNVAGLSVAVRVVASRAVGILRGCDRSGLTRWREEGEVI